MQLFQMIHDFLWGDLITVPLPGDSSLGLSLLVIILIPAGIFCMIITRFLPVRMFPEMIRISMEKRNEADKDRSVSGIEALIVSTATRVGMGNLVGVVAAVSAGGAGAIFWMWLAVVIGSAPCAAASADVDHPVKSGLLQSLGVFIDTIIICSCTAFVMLLVPEEMVSGLSGMDLLQEAMRYHFGKAGVIFIAVTLWLFCFSTFLGILFYARSNVAYIFGDNWTSQTVYKAVALLNLFVGCLATYTFVWDLGDVGIGLMTLFNMIALIPMSKEAVRSLKDYEQNYKRRKITDRS